MKCELTLEIRDLHACPGDRPPKEHIVSKDVFSQEDRESIQEDLDEDLVLEREKGRQTKKTRDKIEPLYAFRIENGKPMMRLGGAYGKLAGLFRDAGSSLWQQKTKGFTKGYKSFLKSLVIKPQWVELDKASGIEIATIPQILAGRSKAMIIQYYEKIPHCTAEIGVEMPETMKEQFKVLMKQAEGMPFGPKRRGEIVVHEMRWI